MNDKLQQIMDITQEECAEVIQMVSKIRRFGLDEMHLKGGKTNRELLTEEVGDVMLMVDLLLAHGVFTNAQLEEAKQAKATKLTKWSTIYED